MSNDEGYKDQAELISAEIGITKLDLTVSPRKIGEVLDEIMPQGAETKAEDWVDEPIVIHSIRFFVGQYGAAAFVVFTDTDGVLWHFILGQKIIVPKLAAVREVLPVSATLRKKEGGQFGKYYDIE